MLRALRRRNEKRFNNRNHVNTDACMGIVFTGIGLVFTIEYLARPSAYSAYAILMWLSIVVVTALVAWRAYMWQED